MQLNNDEKSTNYSPSAIDREGGLKPYLDRRKVFHNGYGYDDLVTWARDPEISTREIARRFGKHYHTVGVWVKMLRLDGIIDS